MFLKDKTVFGDGTAKPLFPPLQDPHYPVRCKVLFMDHTIEPLFGRRDQLYLKDKTIFGDGATPPPSGPLEPYQAPCSAIAAAVQPLPDPIEKAAS